MSTLSGDIIYYVVTTISSSVIYIPTPLFYLSDTLSTSITLSNFIITPPNYTYITSPYNYISKSSTTYIDHSYFVSTGVYGKLYW